MITTIQPVLSLENLSTWDEATLPVWPSSGNIEVANDTEIVINLESINYYLNYDDIVPSSFKPLKVEVSWSDNTTSEYFYNITDNSNPEVWLSNLQNWLKNIGPHRYNFSTPEIGNKTIVVKIFDSSGNIFGFKILLDVLSQSIYNLNLEIDIKKAVFNSETASVVFKIDTVGKSIIKNTKIPVVSILN